MKTLKEKKMLVRLAKMLGEEVDPALLESIEREEKLTKVLFPEEKKIIGYEEGTTFLNRKPIFEEPTVNDEPIVEEAIVEAAVPQVAPSTAETNLVSPDLIQQTVNALSQSKPIASSGKSVPEMVRDKDIDAMKKSIADLVRKVGTLSWGGGGTGVVKFVDLDDHRAPRDIDRIELNLTGTDYTPPGTLTWNSDEDCLNIHQEDGSTLQTGLENYIRVYNQSGSVLENGTLVTFGGIDGGDPIAIKATANSTFDPLFTIGVLTNDIQNLSHGRATTFGKVHNLNTTGSDVSETWAVGDLLWMHPSQAGKMTKVKPTPSNAIISVAAVTKVHATDGEILVRPVIEYRKHYGSFSDTGVGNHVATNINVPQMAHLTTTDFSSGHTLGANNNVVAQFAGLYNYQFSIQVTSTNAASKNIYIWPRKNGQNIPNSASVFSVGGNGGNAVPAWNFIIPMSAGDEFQLMWAVDDTALVLKGSTTTAFSPAIPTTILTVTQVA